jgi:hypothetical protein
VQQEVHRVKGSRARPEELPGGHVDDVGHRPVVVGVLDGLVVAEDIGREEIIQVRDILDPGVVHDLNLVVPDEPVVQAVVVGPDHGEC